MESDRKDDVLIARAGTTSADGFGATETNGVQIETIDVSDSLGSVRVGREEHSGENVPADMTGELADNDLGQVPPQDPDEPADR
ncbi:MAG TPA: hypothetical protein VNA04_06360 [Thermoanaerobaculia bacterium]|nr:hypothetical protein [Thermoanaerobaculia bacterium]